MPINPLKYLTIAALIAAFAPARAASVTYRYSSNDLTQVLAGSCLTLTSRVTMSFSLGKKLPGNFIGVITPKSWTASDGVSTYTNTTIASIPNGTPMTAFMVWTDASGNIINWYVYMESVIPASHGVIWAALSNNMPAPNNAGNAVEAVENTCHGFAKGTDSGLWITPN